MRSCDRTKSKKETFEAVVWVAVFRSSWKWPHSALGGDGARAIHHDTFSTCLCGFLVVEFRPGPGRCACARVDPTIWLGGLGQCNACNWPQSDAALPITFPVLALQSCRTAKLRPREKLHALADSTRRNCWQCWTPCLPPVTLPAENACRLVGRETMWTFLYRVFRVAVGSV